MTRMTAYLRRVPRHGGLLCFLFALFGSTVNYGLVAWSETSDGANGALTPIKLLNVEPVKGYAGETFTVHGDGLPAGKKVEFLWSTVEASFLTKVMTDNVEYHERKYDEKRVAFGTALVDAQGRVNAKFTAPEDFGEVHDLYAVVDGKE